jgi:GH24 family phage-related lysozyme (muramidase)
MDRDAIKEHIEAREGRRDSVYTDTTGHPTIGVGFNLDRSDARAKITELGLDYDQVRSGKQTLSDTQIDTLLDADVDQATSDAQALVSNFDSIPDDKQVVVTDMVFNMGATKFGKFSDTIDAIENEDWDAAADGMQDSKWFGQVGTRGTVDVEIMRGGSDQGS